jgi:hypothetical protein
VDQLVGCEVGEAAAPLVHHLASDIAKVPPEGSLDRLDGIGTHAHDGPLDVDLPLNVRCLKPDDKLNRC